MSETLHIDETLQTLLNQLSTVQLRKAFREIATLLRKQSISNIKAQKNPDGSAYAPRKNIKVRRKMLTGFGRHIKKKVDINQVAVGIFGKASNLAKVHHEGQDEKGIKYPSRKLIGLSPEIKEEIRIILLRHIAPHP